MKLIKSLFYPTLVILSVSVNLVTSLVQLADGNNIEVKLYKFTGEPYWMNVAISTVLRVFRVVFKNGKQPVCDSTVNFDW